jgi:ATP-dependent protease ClpP protease subunit
MKILPISNTYAKQYAGFRVQMAGTEAELELYGEIVESQPMDWWGDPIKGSWIIQDDVLTELKSLKTAGAKKLRLRINSLGGDAGVAITIHNRLREMSAEGMAIRCVIDGVAASGGSLIACACDEVEVFGSSLFMVHKCWGFLFGGYNADELRAEALARDAWDQAQINIYHRKSGLSETVLSHMMSDTTYLTGQQIVDKGFADVLSEGEGAKVAASADGRSLLVNGVRMHLAPGMVLPDSVPVENENAANVNGGISSKIAERLREILDCPVYEDDTTADAPGAKVTKEQLTDYTRVSTGETPEDIENQNMPAGTGEEGGNQTMATNLNELRTENPELAAQVEADVRAGLTADTNAAVEAERNRLREIDAISALYGDEAVQAAKYGDHPMTAQELAYAQAQAAAQQGTAFAAAMQEDAAQANDVPAAAAKADDGEVDVEAAAKADYKAYIERKEGKK